MAVILNKYPQKEARYFHTGFRYLNVDAAQICDKENLLQLFTRF